MSKARELAELSRTVSDSADAVAITIDSSENVSFANGIDVTGTADVSSQVLVGGNDTIIAENNLRFKSGGGAFIDHNTTGQSITFRTSNASSLDTTAVTIDSSGAVGIGTSSPSSYPVASELVVDTGVSGGITVVSDSTSGGYGGVFFADGTTGNEQYRGFIQYNHNNGGSVDGLLLGTSGAERMRIDSSGNVGIGTNSPNAAADLHVADTSDTRIWIEATSGDTMELYAGTDVSVFNRSNNALKFGTNNTERMRINSSGWVNPKSNVALTNAPDTQGLHFGWNYSNGAGESLIVFNKGAGTTGGLTFVDNSTGGTHDEVMRLEGGNLLVGGTDTDPGSTGNSANAGTAIGASGYVSVARTGGSAIRAGRIDSDGAIIEFFGDGASVGSIGVTGGDILFLTCESHGIKINSDAARIDPSDGSGNSSDGVLDLGDSGARFKDLYLSSGVNFSANSNAAGMTSELLDDYEEGTFTPAFVSPGTGAVHSIQIGTYTKVGRLVTASVYLQLSTVGTGAGNISVSGFPFATSTGANDRYSGTGAIHGTSWAADTGGLQGLIAGQGATSVTMYKNMCAASGTTFLPTHADMGGGNLLFTISYFAS
jgi:hypothetical protein